MHTIVAGSTGSGKSFASQVIAEEALENDVAVVIFDPTAQWTGFLRELEQDNIKELFKAFGMNPKKDTTSYKGNIIRVDNPLEIIDLDEYMKPGEITIFDCHKMSFEDLDKFVANTVSQVFMSELDEQEDLRLLMCYDEVHRLLPKFGGSGAGFMQIERACREFRKWGIGVLLISQVLSDFMNEIKANINTEVLMRTRDEEDLEHVSMKYGDNVVQSLVKASVGTGMLQNSDYNKGRPYLTRFRPVKHAIERLPEGELQQYQNYNDKIRDLRHQIKQLQEKHDVDPMDYEIELNLAENKLKEARFDIVEMYLEETEKTIHRKWEDLGDEPEPRKKELLDEATMQRYIELAKRERNDVETRPTTRPTNNEPVEELVEDEPKNNTQPVCTETENASEKDSQKEQKKTKKPSPQNQEQKSALDELEGLLDD